MNGPNGYEDGGEYQVNHDTGPEVDHGHVEFVAALRTVTEGEDEASYERGEVKPFEDHAEESASRGKEVFVAEGNSKDVEDEEEIALETN